MNRKTEKGFINNLKTQSPGHALGDYFVFFSQCPFINLGGENKLARPRKKHNDITLEGLEPRPIRSSGQAYH